MALTTMAVVASFSVEDLATRPLGEIADAMRATGDAAEVAREAVAGLASVRLGNLAASMRNAAEAAATLRQATDGMAANLSSAGAAAGSSASGFDAMAASMANATRAHAEMMEQLGRPVMVPPPVYSGQSYAPLGGPGPALIGRDGPTIDGYASDAADGGAIAMAGGGGLSGGGGGAASMAGAPRQIDGPARVGGAGGGGGFGGRVPPIVPIPRGRGGGGFGGFGLGSMVFDVGVGAGLHDAADEQLAVIQTLQALDLPADPNSAAGRAIARSFDDGAIGTIYSSRETAQVGQAAAGVLGRSGASGLRMFSQLDPIVTRLGELSELRHKGRAADEAVAGIEVAHLIGNYDPKSIEPDLDVVNAIAQREHTSVQQQQRILRYDLPLMMSLGLSPHRALLETGFSEQRLGATTTAATSEAAMLIALLHAERPHSAVARHRLESQTKVFRDALALESPGAAVDFDRQRAHLGGTEQVKALHELGLTDAHGNLTVLNADGSLDISAFHARLRQYGATHHGLAAGAVAERAFLRQGSRAAMVDFNSDTKGNYDAFTQSVDGAGTVRQQQAEQARGAAQQGEQAEKRIRDLLNQLMAQTLPGVIIALSATTAAVTGLTGFLRDHPVAAEAAGYGALGLAGLTGVSLLTGIARGPLRAAGAIGGLGLRGIGAALGALGIDVGGIAGAGGAAVAAGGAAAGAGIGGGLLLGGGALAAGGIGYGLARLGEMIDREFPALGRLDAAAGLGSGAHATAAVHAGVAAATSPATPASSNRTVTGAGSSTGGGSANVSVHDVNLSVQITGGTIDAMVREIVARVERDLPGELQRAFDAAGGFSGGVGASIHAIAGGRP